MIATALLAGLALTQFSKVYFDYNLLHMQSKGLASVIYEKKLLFSGQSVLYAAIEADSLPQARQFEMAVQNLPVVASVDGSDKGEAFYDILTSDPTKKLQLVRDIKQQVADFHFAPVDPGPVDLNELGATLWETMGYLDWAIEETKKEKDQASVTADLQSLHDTISAFRVKMLSGADGIPQRLREYQQALFTDLHGTFAALRDQDTSSGLRTQDLPPAIRNRFVGVTGKYRLLVFPKKDIWQRQNQKEFIDQLRAALPGQEDRVTGTPVQLFEYEKLLKDSYLQAALYALVAIAFMVLVHFRSLLCVLLSLLPVAIGATWLLGLMGLTGIPFNPADIMTLPLVIGIGVTNGIHILNRFAEEQAPGILAKSTGKAVLVSGLTAMTGFGSLILARHQGIQSLGLVMSIGIAACMVAGLTFLPALLNILFHRGWTVQIKRPGSDNARSLPDPEEPR